MSQTYLKIKIMSLAAEARIIRREELRWYGGSSLRSGLRSHRVHEVRSEARVALLAYGYLRGRAYAAIETHPLVQPDLSRVTTLAVKYGPDKRLTRDTILAWTEGVAVEVKKAA